MSANLQRPAAPDRAFIPDLTELRNRAREQIMKGAVTAHADLVAERLAIESYREMITVFGQRDPTTRRLFESILAQEEEHAEDLVDLLEDLPKD